MKLLTIAIPTYNGAKHLLKNFERSHLDSDDVEYLIVDDGSKDNTLEVAKKFAKKYKNVKVHHQKNTGYGGVCNAVFKMVDTKYLYILDCDDYLDAKVLKYEVNEMKKMSNKNIDIFGTHFAYQNPSGKTFKDGIERFVAHNKIITAKDIKKFTVYSFFMCHNLIFNTRLLKEHPIELPLCYYCDTQFAAYLLMYADKYYFFDEVLYYYQVGTADQSVSFLSVARNYTHYLKMFESTMKMVTKEEYQAIKSKRQKDLVMHYVFCITFLALYSSYIFYNKNRDKVFKSYIKRAKKENSYIFNLMVWKSVYKFTYLIPKRIRGRFFIIGKRKFAKEIAWEV